MARIEDIERGLLNWARWSAQMESGGGNYARTDMSQERVDCSGGWDTPAPIPTNDAEAELYDKAVAALRADLKEAVKKEYLEGGKVKNKARALGISEATWHLRIGQAHIAISGWLRDRRIAQEDQRKRVEKLQRSVKEF